MSYSINISGHVKSDSEVTSDNENFAKAKAFVATLDGVTAATYSGPYNSDSLMPEQAEPMTPTEKREQVEGNTPEDATGTEPKPKGDGDLAQEKGNAATGRTT